MRYHGYEDTMNAFEKLECVADLYNVRLITIESERGRYNYQTHECDFDIPIARSSSYGDWKEVKECTPINPATTYVMSDYTGGSDYSGDLVNVANYKAMLEMIPSEYEDGFEYVTFSGGYSTFDIAIRIDALTAEILDAIHSLSDYPLLDESLHSELESESQNEAWENDIRSEFKTALGKELFATWENSSKADQRDDESDEQYSERLQATEEYLSDECADISDSDLAELCWKMMDLSNEYWTNEQGSDSYLDVDDVIKKSMQYGDMERPPKHLQTDYHVKAYSAICALIRSSMSDAKYDLGIVRYVNPNQLTLPYSQADQTEVN